MVVIAFTYCITGLHKLQFTGFDWASSDNLRWVLYTASDSQNGNSLGLFIADHPLLAHLFAWGTLVVECTFPLALLWPVSRWFYVPGRRRDARGHLRDDAPQLRGDGLDGDHRVRQLGMDRRPAGAAQR